MAFSIKSVFRAVKSFVEKYAFVWDLLKHIDITKLNEDDRDKLGVLADEFDEAGDALKVVAEQLRDAKAGGLSPDDYGKIAEAIYEAGDELADLPKAVKEVF